jgi:hypothetical protein
MTDSDYLKEYSNGVRLDDEEGVVKVVTQSVLGLRDAVNNRTDSFSEAAYKREGNYPQSNGFCLDMKPWEACRLTFTREA